jgi:hypothetical protein
MADEQVKLHSDPDVHGEKEELHGAPVSLRAVGMKTALELLPECHAGLLYLN